MRPGRQVHCFVVGAHTLGQRHWHERRFLVWGSARVPRVGESVPLSRTFERLFWRDAETSTRDACATQQIIVQRFFAVPHRRAPMIRETIEGPELRQRAQFFLRKQHAPLEIVQRIKLSILPLPDKFFRVFLPQSVHHGKSQAHGVIGNNCAAPCRFLHTNRLNLQPVPARIFHNCGRSVKTHWLIVQQTCIKLRRAMHFQIGAAISENGKTDRV